MKSILLFVSIVLTACSTTPPECADLRTIKDIISVNPKTAIFLLDDGSTVEIEETILMPGDKYCKRYK